MCPPTLSLKCARTDTHPKLVEATHSLFTEAHLSSHPARVFTLLSSPPSTAHHLITWTHFATTLYPTVFCLTLTTNTTSNMDHCITESVQCLCWRISLLTLFYSHRLAYQGHANLLTRHFRPEGSQEIRPDQVVWTHSSTLCFYDWLKV